MKTVLSLMADPEDETFAGIETLGDQVDFVELRLDRMRVAALPRWIERCPVPVIATVIPREEGGLFEGTRDDSIVLLRAAAAAGARHVDLDVSIARQACEELPARCKPIVSLHDRRATPRDLQGLFHSVQAVIPGAMVKVVTTARTVEDSLRLVRALDGVRGSIAAFCMGEPGRVSRLLSGIHGGALLYLAHDRLGATAPGQWTLSEYRVLVPRGSIEPDWKVYGVIGKPLGHSLSPAAHGAAFRECTENTLYLPFEVEDPAFLLDLGDTSFQGFSVTIPHKEKVVAACESLSEDARRIGAVNTLVRGKRGWYGENTDHRGMVRALEGVPIRLRDRRALVLGGGGAARAAVHGLRVAGAKVAVAVREPARVREWVESAGALLLPWPERTRWATDVLINATPMGLMPAVDDTPFPAEGLRPDMAVLDMVYRPLQTRLLREAEALGAQVVPGLSMFLEQAFLQFEAWTNLEAPRQVMRQAILAALRSEER